MGKNLAKKIPRKNSVRSEMKYAFIEMRGRRRLIIQRVLTLKVQRASNKTQLTIPLILTCFIHGF